MRTGLAIANSSAVSTTVYFEISRLNGSVAAPAIAITIPPRGQIARFINELFPALTADFKGVIRVTAASPIAVSGIRGRTNERSDFLVTTTPPLDEAAPAPSTAVFPHIVNGGGYSTELILLGTLGAGRLWLRSQDGSLQSGVGLIVN